MWSCERLSSSALISANHVGKLVMLHLLTEEWHMGQKERTSVQLKENAQINHVSDVEKSKNLIKI